MDKKNYSFNMEDLVQEMLEDFLMSAACSRYFQYDDGDEDGQDMLKFIKYMDHVELCNVGAEACRDYLKNKNKLMFIYKLAKIGITIEI